MIGWISDATVTARDPLTHTSSLRVKTFIQLEHLCIHEANVAIYTSYLYFIILLQGILFTMADAVKTPIELVRLWIHEANRVYRDKLVDEEDMATFDKVIKDVVKKTFEVRMQENII